MAQQRSTCFIVLKWALFASILASIALQLVNSYDSWDQLEQWRTSSDGYDQLKWSFWLIESIILVVGCIGVLFEHYGFVMALGITWVIKTAIDIFFIVQRQIVANILNFVLTTIVTVMICTYGYRIEMEGGSSCTVC